MILLTGAAGFIGSCMLSLLNQRGREDIVIADDFSRADKKNNWQGKRFLRAIDRESLLRDGWPEALPPLSAIIHLGARTDTTATDTGIFQHLNLRYSQKLWQWACERQIPFLYASSAATYGDGSLGFHDNAPDLLPALNPLNAYAQSKQQFDLWALAQKETPPQWQGFKFFNVYGPNEYHKGRMASVVMHTFRQVRETGGMRLFRSHHPDFRDGEQRRDFIHVEDVVETLHHFLNHSAPNGLYNLGTGRARTFRDLAESVFQALGKAPNITFIDTPEDIRDKYQYFTESDNGKLRAAYPDCQKFRSLEEGVTDYVRHFLIEKKYY